MTLGERIFTLRRGLGLTQKEVAKKIGVAKMTISEWEGGRSIPPLIRLPAIASVFNLTASELIADVDLAGSRDHPKNRRGVKVPSHH